jgi:hypothetical protein
LRPASDAFSQIHSEPPLSFVSSFSVLNLSSHGPRHGHTPSVAADHGPPLAISLRRRYQDCDYFFRVRMKATSPLTSSGVRDPYLGILFLPLAMISVSSASDIFCTSADVKS